MKTGLGNLKPYRQILLAAVYFFNSIFHSAWGQMNFSSRVLPK